MSTSRIMSSSSHPPWYPATNPKKVPTVPPIPRVTAATINDILAP